MNSAWQKQMEILFWQGTLLAAIGSAIMMAGMMWAAYTVLKYGIRAGMLAYDKERRRTGLPTASPQAAVPGEAPKGFKWVLVPDDALPNAAKPIDMRADR